MKFAVALFLAFFISGAAHACDHWHPLIDKGEYLCLENNTFDIHPKVYFKKNGEITEPAPGRSYILDYGRPVMVIYYANAQYHEGKVTGYTHYNDYYMFDRELPLDTGQMVRFYLDPSENYEKVFAYDEKRHDYFRIPDGHYTLSDGRRLTVTGGSTGLPGNNFEIKSSVKPTYIPCKQWQLLEDQKTSVCIEQQDGTDTNSALVFLRRENKVTVPEADRYVLADGKPIILTSDYYQPVSAQVTLSNGKDVECYYVDAIGHESACYYKPVAGIPKLTALPDGDYTLKNGTHLKITQGTSNGDPQNDFKPFEDQ